ncbi:hypothetical protein Patl1_22855 [Pistacia atlantica]|uniref:Uncharacterized protein n=1 Tax=Pistacia atlantica TaxID=434234 RepID=A0ACC1A1P7_9ROSI|nr:hypothetical protein Patl1_22855 [Pistacia atlantica]
MGEREAGSSSSLAGAGESQLEIVVLHDDNALIPVSDEVKKWLGSILNGESTENQHEAICSKIEKVPGMLRDKHKLTMARQYVKGVNPKLLEELYQKVSRLAIDAKQCYTDLSEVAKKDEDTDQSSVAKKNEDTDHGSVADEEFSQMMFLDACFILQFIYCIVKNEPKALKMKSNMIALVQRDLFLLENQIPFQLLNELSFESKFGDENEKQELLNNEGAKAAGIHFRPSETNRFADVVFQTGYLAVLKLPPIYIDDSTKSMLLNMVAYESSPNGPDDFGVSSYVCLMDSLIDHAEDVEELRSKGILLNFLGSDQQVADLFNEIADNLMSHPYAYAAVKDDIEKH